MSTNSGSTTSAASNKKTKTAAFADFLNSGTSLGLALKASKKTVSRTSFTRFSASSDTCMTQTSAGSNIAFKHVVFQENSQSSRITGNSQPDKSMATTTSRRPRPAKSNKPSLWSRAVAVNMGKRK